jgi:hypothetical protein
MNESQLERLGQLADKADNFWHASKLPHVKDSVHKDCLASGMKEISDELKRLYVEVASNDPWELQPK